MSTFSMYFSMGRQHIADANAIDHILFIAALCIRYVWSDWKKLLILVTAFTIGHSVTLALSTFNIISFNRNLTEFLIALTIFITAISNCLVKEFSFKSKYPAIYFMALFFGLIHGMGFSSMLKSMLGKSQSVVTELFAFNLGIEAGQLMIVAAILMVSFILMNILKVNRKSYLLFCSGGIASLALELAVQRWPG